MVNHVLQYYEAREDNMTTYLTLIRQVVEKLKGLSITQIPSEENVKADRLARLASSLEADLRGTRV